MTTNANILIVDDDPAVGRVLGALLKQADYEVVVADSAPKAFPVVEAGGVDLVISDVRMPEMTGIEFLRELAILWPDLPVVMLTAHGSVERAVEAMKIGAAEYLLKPFDKEEILFVIDKCLRPNVMEKSPPPAVAPSGDSKFIGQSEPMQDVLDLVERAARSDATVLVRGETGTGKELVARAVHEQSQRADGPWLKVHCAALPETLLESELFGYEKGAFTGATSRKPGRIELAHGGTIFLDEIGDITAATQVKLLRVLQDREFERVGGTRTLRADVRFVAATHRNLEEMVDAGEFREDLFYRLNVIPIWLPPLRDRPGDIDEMAVSFCARFAEENERDVRLTADAIRRLCEEDWPGNVRQLQNLVERMVVLSDKRRLTAEHVERELGRSPRRTTGPRPAISADDAVTLDEHRRRAEAEAVQNALRRCNGNRSQAARILGVSRRTLYNKLDELGLD